MAHQTEAKSSSGSLHCIIGAGYCGLALARAYRQAGVAYVQLEASDRVGGVWAHRAYDSLHTVTSKASTAYPGDAMPGDYPDFPSGRQMLAYLETVAEVGIVGAMLLLAALAPPLLAARHGRDRQLVAVAAGGFAAFLVHAGLDWDWEMPVTTLAGLACAAALLAAARRFV